ncbi:hypothetical protein Zm00014a_006728 [Zea mays]|uniref:Uncharacterized protein n=1 Tax=Zea mays TaxID=4577 RepID=A0A317YH77_MAIZE|nr:hypothetical protein Zm00014a_006728 [Zea mays]
MAVEVDARWEPMGAQEYYDYWRAMYNARGNSLNFIFMVLFVQVHRLVKHVCPKVNIQKDNGVQMKIIGTHVDATEIVYDEDSYNKTFKRKGSDLDPRSYISGKQALQISNLLYINVVNQLPAFVSFELCLLPSSPSNN